MDVYRKMMQFVERELKSIQDKDAVPVREYISIFTNRRSLDQWYNTETNIKILLSTSGSSTEETFIKLLFNISRVLHSLGIEIGIAFPSISSGTSLSIKTNENSKHYPPEDISYVLSIIGVIIGSGSPMEILFHTLNASLFEISLPLNKEEMKDINKLIDILYRSKIVYISPSRIDTLQQITENDGVWKFLIPLEALYTSLDATEKLRTLTTDSTFKGKNCEWIVGSLGIVKTYSAPLLIALHNSKIQAICFDNLDLIFTKLFNLLNEDSVLETHFQILSNVTNRKSFYSDRVYYAIKLNDMITCKESPNIDTEAFTMQSFDEKCDPKLKDAIKLTRWIISENDSSIIMNLIGLTVHSLPNINDTLSTHLWSESNCTLFGKNVLEKDEWIIIKNSLQEYFTVQSPFLSRINFAIDIIEKFTTNGNITDENELIANNALQAIVEDKECTEVMKKDINLWMENDRTHRFTGVKKVLTGFIKVQSNSEQYFHLRNVISLISELLVDSNNGINKYDLLAKYIERIKLNNEMYPNANERLNDLMKRRLLHPLLTQLYKYSHDSRLFFIHREFDQLSDINDSNSIIRLLTNLYNFDQINEKQWIDIWLNEQFLYLIRQHLTDIRIQKKIAFNGCKYGKIPHYIPEDIALVIIPICVEQSQRFREIFFGTFLNMFSQMNSPNY